MARFGTRASAPIGENAGIPLGGVATAGRQFCAVSDTTAEDLEEVRHLFPALGGALRWKNRYGSFAHKT